MIIQELIHNATNTIWCVYNRQILEDSVEYIEFQNSEDPSILGYTFVETLEKRMNDINNKQYE